METEFVTNVEIGVVKGQSCFDALVNILNGVKTSIQPNKEYSYSVKWAIEKYNRGEMMVFIPFWGHTMKPGKIRKQCFSQWFPCDFIVDNVHYHTSEQFMMAQKALLFGDYEVYEQIMEADNPSDFKALGRKIRGFDEEIWDKHKFEIVVKGNIAKFGQNPELREFLLSTGEKIPVEASPYDGIWGVKLGIDSEDINNPNLWKGQNLLGFALMEARDFLREETEICN